MVEKDTIVMLQQKVVQIMAHQLEEGKTTQGELSQIAEYVLTQSSKIESEDELITFLSRLAERWEMFHDLYLIESGRIKEALAKEQIHKALNLTKEGKIDEALQVAKGTTY